MEDITIIKYNIYYLLRDIAEGYNVILAEEDPELIDGDTIFIQDMIVSNRPLQLGSGLTRTVGFMITILSSNGVKHDDMVSLILDRFYNNGRVIYDYNPIGNVSNFPYLPADGTEANPDYVETIYGFMDFVYADAQNLFDEELDRQVYKRTVITFNVDYAKE